MGVLQAGLDIPKLRAHVAKDRYLAEFEGGTGGWHGAGRKRLHGAAAWKAVGCSGRAGHARIRACRMRGALQAPTQAKLQPKTTPRPPPPAIPNDITFFDIPADVFIPAAVLGTVTAEAAARMQCHTVIEAANGGITPEANKASAAHTPSVVAWRAAHTPQGGLGRAVRGGSHDARAKTYCC